MARALIVDDVPADRRSLTKLLRRVLPEHEPPLEAGSVGEMYARLGQQPDLLFLDVALEPGQVGPDSSGLIALYDIVDSYPSLPVIVVTGYFAEKAKEILHGAMDCRSVVGCLDKADYDDDLVERVLGRVARFRAEVAQRQSESEFADLVFAEAEERIETERKRLEANLTAEELSLKLYRAAFSGTDWRTRVVAEAKLNGGRCNQNATAMGIVMEKRVRDLCAGDHVTFHDRAWELKDRFELPWASFQLLKEAWTVRNRVVHSQATAKREHGLLMVTALSVLDEIDES